MTTASLNIALGASFLAALLASGYLFGRVAIPNARARPRVPVAIAGTILLCALIGLLVVVGYVCHWAGAAIRTVAQP